MQYNVYMKGPAGILEIVLEVPDGTEVGGTVDTWRISNSHFPAVNIIAVVPRSELQGRTTLGVSGR